MQQQTVQVIAPMVEAKFALFKVQREVAELDPPPTGEPRLGRRPEAFNAVNVVATPPIDEDPAAVPDAVMLRIADRREAIIRMSFDAAAHLKAHPEYGWESSILRDLPAYAWTELAGN